MNAFESKAWPLHHPKSRACYRIRLHMQTFFIPQPSTIRTSICATTSTFLALQTLLLSTAFLDSSFTILATNSSCVMLAMAITDGWKELPSLLVMQVYFSSSKQVIEQLFNAMKQMYSHHVHHDAKKNLKLADLLYSQAKITQFDENSH
jgi:hypothetical protein